jgi:hypothetical protein
MKIRPVGTELFHADGWKHVQTDRQYMTKLLITFRNFATAPNSLVLVLILCNLEFLLIYWSFKMNCFILGNMQRYKIY